MICVFYVSNNFFLPCPTSSISPFHLHRITFIFHTFTFSIFFPHSLHSLFSLAPSYFHFPFSYLFSLFHRVSFSFFHPTTYLILFPFFYNKLHSFLLFSFFHICDVHSYLSPFLVVTIGFCFHCFLVSVYFHHLLTFPPHSVFTFTAFLHFCIFTTSAFFHLHIILPRT